MASVMRKLGLEHNFSFGHQGWEYADIGRFWQWFFFVGLMLWLVLVGRALWPALRADKDGGRWSRCCSCRRSAIGLFYAAGLVWVNIATFRRVEYWRWWMVFLGRGLL